MRLKLALNAEPYRGESTRVLGPAPASVSKVNNRYRYRLTLSCDNNKAVRSLLSWSVKEFVKDRQYKDVAVYVDVNPYD